MRFHKRWLGMLIVLVAVFVVGLAPAAAQDESMPPAYDYAGYLFDAINSLRAEHGLYPLTYNFQLEQAAMVQADWMVANWSFAHYHNGSRPSTRAAEAGYTGYDWCCGENTFLSPDPSPAASFAFWMSSSSHYYQMLSKWHTEIGIGYFVGETRTGQVMVFGQKWSDGSGGATSGEVVETAPVAQSAPAVEAEPAPPPVDANGCASQHVVNAGENLFRISLSYGVSMDAVAASSGVADYTALSIGQVLCIPGGGTVTYVATAGGGSPGSPQNVALGSPVDNWCFPGGQWGDGRCNDPDPAVSKFLWDCGYYLAHDIHKEGC